MESPSCREPYPDVLFNEIGSGFVLGAIYSSTRYSIKGIYNSPKGQRLVGASQALRLHAPRVTGRFAARFGLFDVFETILHNARGQKEDPWNRIMAGAATGAFVKLRHGVRAASRSSIIGAGTLALLEGLGIVVERYPIPDEESSRGRKYVAGPGFPVKEPEPIPFSIWSV